MPQNIGLQTALELAESSGLTSRKVNEFTAVLFLNAWQNLRVSVIRVLAIDKADAIETLKRFSPNAEIVYLTRGYMPNILTAEDAVERKEVPGTYPPVPS